jgi:DNA-binding response OmpR family regulator
MTPRPRVMLVEDDALVRRVLGLVLRGAPWDVVVHAGGAEALEQLAREPFDVVVTDVRMPVVSGLDVARWCRTNRPATRVVLITGFTADDDEDGLTELGTALLRKPFEGSELVALVRALLERS